MPRTAANALPPTDGILSSRGLEERHIIPVHTFHGASELELRGEHIDAILGSSFMTMWAPPGPQSLTTCQQRLLTRGLRRALHLCNRVSTDSLAPYPRDTLLRVFRSKKTDVISPRRLS